MPIVALPPQPDLDRLKGVAKQLRDGVRAGADRAVALVRTHHPRHATLAAGSPAAAAFTLADAQLTLARHHGFASWPKLRAHVLLVRGLSRSPHQVPSAADPADEVLRLACLTYGADAPGRPAGALDALRARPELARASAWTMAAFGDSEALAGALRADPAAANREGGPFGWAPLLYATYSRVRGPGDDVDEAATVRLLLEAGADPHVGFLWDGYAPPFTALTGALGGGEGSQPPHARWRELAVLLLDAGASANDAQAVYNQGLGDVASDDTEVLELLLARGLGRGDGGAWARRLAPHHPAPADLLAELLQHAAAHGLGRRAALLLAHGADPDRRATHPAFGGHTPYESAVTNGNLAIAEQLVRAGAASPPIDSATAFVAACLAGQDATARAVLAEDPELAARARAQDPGAVVRAAELGRAGGIGLLVAFGWDVNAKRRTTALHEAALRGDVEVARLLLALGADLTIVDDEHGATPAGWAAFAGHTDLAAELAPPAP